MLIIYWIESGRIILNWIFYVIESQQLILNWIIFWIEFSWNNIESNIELNQFWTKFKHRNESIWVSNRARGGSIFVVKKSNVPLRKKSQNTWPWGVRGGEVNPYDQHDFRISVFSIEDFPKVYSKIQVNSVYAKHYIAGHRMIHQYVIVMHHFLALDTVWCRI